MKPGIWLLLFAQAAGEVAVTGRVTDALTHQPIAEARVTLCCPEVGARSVTDGTYSVPRKPSGSEAPFVTITKAGYATLHEALADSRDFEQTPSAHIKGRLIDRDTGKQIVGPFVKVWHQEGGSLKDVTNIESTQDGSFTTTNDLLPGEYLLEAVPAPFRRITAGKPGSDEEGYGSTWFPGVPIQEMAAKAVLTPGETRFIEIPLQKRELRHVAGTIEVPEGHEKDTFRFFLTNGRWPEIAQAGSFKPGPFHIEGLEEGTYILFAKTGKGLSGSQSTEVGSHSIDDLKLSLRDDVAVRATVKVREDGVKWPDRMSLYLSPMPENQLNSVPTGKLRIERLPAGHYWPELNLPPGFTVIAVSYGGQSVLNTPVDFEARESTGDFTITSRPASVSGTVRGTNQKPEAGVAVTLMPDSAAKPAPLLERRLSAKSDVNGAFRIAGLAPGKYHVSGFGDAVELDFGQNATLELHAK